MHVLMHIYLDNVYMKGKSAFDLPLKTLQCCKNPLRSVGIGGVLASKTLQ